MSNIGQTAATVTNTASLAHAQGFTTGSHAAGYTLESIGIPLTVRAGFSDADRQTLRAQLWSAKTDGSPNAKLADLTVPSSMTTGTVTFAAPANTTLTANTVYHLVFYSTGTLSGGSRLWVGTTSTNNEDSGAATGWSIADGSYFQRRNEPLGTATWVATAGELRIAVNGFEGQAAAPGAPTGLTVTPGNAQLSVSWTAPSGTVTGYDVHYTSSTSVAAGAAVQAVSAAAGWLAVSRSGTTASQTISTLMNGTPYRVRVRAKNTGGNSAWVEKGGTPSATGTIWSATLTVKQLTGSARGCNNSRTGSECSSALTDDDFTLSGTTWEIKSFTTSTSAVELEFNRDVRTLLDSYNFCVGTTALAFSSASHLVGNAIASFNTRVAADWNIGDTPSLSIGTSCAQQVTRSTNANLSGLTAASATSSTGTFTDFSIGTFGATTTTYTATVANTQTHLKLTPTVDDTGKATVLLRKGSEGGFASVTSGSAGPAIALDVGANAITVRVTAEDGMTSKDYTVTVTRRAPQTSLSTNANLSALAASSATGSTAAFNALTLSPAFSASETSYTATVANNQTHLKVTPTVDDTGKAAVSVFRGAIIATVTSGSASSAIPLSVGSNLITARVTAEDGATAKDYAITVIRQAGTGQLSAPSNLSYVPANASVAVSWTTVEDANRLVVQYCLTSTWTSGSGCSSPSHKLVNELGATSTTVTGLSNGTSYSMRMRAEDTTNLRAASSYTSWQALTPLAVPAAPTNLRVTTGDAQLTLSWTAPSGTVTGYDVHYTSATVDTVSNGAAVQTRGTPLPANGWVAASRTSTDTTASQTITGLSNDTIYRVRVAAAGNGAWAFGSGTTQPTIQFVGHTFFVSEGESRDIVVRLSNALAVATTVTLNVKAGGAATETADFTLSTKTLTFAAGETQAIFTVSAVADMTTEGTEEFELELVAANNAPYALGDETEAEFVVFDASVNPGLVLSSRDTVDEAHSVAITAHLSEAAPTGGAAVTFTLGNAGTATENTDFTLTPKSLTITAGMQTGQVTLNALHDAVDDHGETVVINASVTLSGSEYTATKTITIVQTAPTGLGVTPGAGKLDLAWTAPTAVTPLAYDVHYTSASKTGSSPVADDAAASGSDPSAAWVAVNRNLNPMQLSQSITGLDNGTAYRVRVRATYEDDINREPSGWVHGAGTPVQTTLSANADLSGLTASTSAGSGGPFNALAIGTFGASTTSYTASVLNAQTHLKLTPTVAETGKAGVGVRKGSQGSFTAVTSGTASAEIALDVGANEITVRVTAEDTTTTKDYTVTVTRLPAGTSWVATFTPRNDLGAPSCDGKSNCDSALSDNSFTVGGTAFHFRSISNTAATGAIELRFSPNVNNALKALNFCSGSVSVPLSSASGSGLFIGGGYNMGWTVGTPAEVRLGSSCAVAQPPTAPRNLAVTPRNGGLGLTWINPSQGIPTGFHIEWKAQSAADQAATTADDPTTGWVRERLPINHFILNITNLVNDTAYDVRVRATSAAGNGPWATATGTPQEQAPGAPAGLGVRAGDGTLDLTWTAPSDDGGSAVTGYDVHYTSAAVGTVANDAAVQTGGSPLPADGWVAADRGTESDPPAVSQAISGLTNDTAYRLRVRARNAVGAGGWLSGTGTPKYVPPTPEVTLSASPDPVQEGVTVIVKATLSSPATRTLTFPITVTRGSAEAEDLGTLPTRIRIASGQLRGTADLATREDDDTDDESFTVALDTANLPSGIAAGAVTSVEVTIVDLTAAASRPTVDLSVSPREPVTAGESVTVTATLSVALTSAVTIPLTLTPDTEPPTTRADYGTLASIQIAAGATTGSGTLTTTADDDTGYESFRVLLGDLPAEVARGRWWVRVTIVPRNVPTVSLTAPESVIEGETVTVTAHLSQALSTAVSIPVTSSLNHGAAASHAIAIAANATSGTLDLETEQDDNDRIETLIVEIDQVALLAVEPQVRVVQFSRTKPDNVLVQVLDMPALTTARATVREGPNTSVTFTVRLSYVGVDPVVNPVMVEYTTADATDDWQGASPATAGSDYTATSGTLTFSGPETSKTIAVPILDDAVDEGSEHFLLRLSNAQRAYVKEGSAEVHGVITNDDPLQTMWLARFGRTVGSQVTDAVTGRLDGTERAAHVTVAGQRLDLDREDAGQALAETVAGIAQLFAAPSGAAHGSIAAHGGPADGSPADSSIAAHGNFAPRSGSAVGGLMAGGGLAPRSGPADGNFAPRSGLGARSVTNRDILLGSSFHVGWERGGNGPRRASADAQRGRAGPRFAAWGEVAQARFDGAETDDSGRTRIGGEVLTRVLGADADFGRVLAGVALSLSDGEGAFDNPGVDVGNTGRLASTMTAVSPYVRVNLTERLSAWGLAGAGTGEMSIRFDGEAMAGIGTGLSMRMGAAGARGVLLSQGGSGAMDLALKADAFFVRTGAGKAADSIATDADASRVRLVLEGGRRFSLPNGAMLHPTLELGVRHDGGDAETGSGVELGGTVAYTGASGLSVEASARRLVAHADADYEEWGASAAVRYDPGERGKGLSLSLAPTFGAAASGTERLWGVADARGLAPGAGFSAPGGLAHAGMTLVGELGYGIESYRLRGSVTPTLGYAAQHAGGATLRLGTDYAARPKWLGFELAIGFGVQRGETREGAGWSGELGATMRW